MDCKVMAKLNHEEEAFINGLAREKGKAFDDEAEKCEELEAAQKNLDDFMKRVEVRSKDLDERKDKITERKDKYHSLEFKNRKLVKGEKKKQKAEDKRRHTRNAAHYCNEAGKYQEEVVKYQGKTNDMRAILKEIDLERDTLLELLGEKEELLDAVKRAEEAHNIASAAYNKIANKYQEHIEAFENCYGDNKDDDGIHNLFKGPFNNRAKHLS